MSTVTAASIPLPTPVIEPREHEGPVRFEKSLVDRACLGDADALGTIVRQFIGTAEELRACEYLGTLGIQPFGLKSFVVLTPRRIGALRIGWFGMVEYQDAPLEYTVSGLIAQPSKFGLYVWTLINTLIVLVADGFVFAFVGPGSVLGLLALAVLPIVLAAVWLLTVRLYYAFNKCGMLWAVREGLWVYAFTNRGRMNIANRLHREIFELREQRVKSVAPLP